MHVIFLSSAYFGYVHTWAFESDAWFDIERSEAVITPRPPLPLPQARGSKLSATARQARGSKLSATSIWQRLVARPGRRAEEL